MSYTTFCKQYTAEKFKSEIFKYTYHKPQNILNGSTYVYYRNKILNKILNVNVGRKKLGKNSEPQVGIEPTTLRDLVGCSNH